MTEYVTADSFWSRTASPYEQRGEVIASDLADGTTPDVVSRFRRAILDLRTMPDLAEELYKRKDKVYELILPGLWGKRQRCKRDELFCHRLGKTNERL